MPYEVIDNAFNDGMHEMIKIRPLLNGKYEVMIWVDGPSAPLPPPDNFSPESYPPGMLDDQDFNRHTPPPHPSDYDNGVPGMPSGPADDSTDDSISDASLFDAERLIRLFGPPPYHVLNDEHNDFYVVGGNGILKLVTQAEPLVQQALREGTVRRFRHGPTGMELISRRFVREVDPSRKLTKVRVRVPTDLLR